jgi:eukaryotic-like serine/threonine-protein kinase
MPADTCPNCGSRRPANAPKGLCPRCLLTEGLRGADASGVHQLTVTLGPASSSVVALLGESLGGIPAVLLRDSDADPDPRPGPLLKPSSAEMPDRDLRSARLQLFGEIARGGMGAVLKGRDSDLGRDLAVKVLLEKHRDDPDLIRRFVEEAQIGGQLQHPGVVPVYELGSFGDRRPYFAMKLVKGQTLAELLSARSAAAHDLPRFLSVYASVAQTMAYAHTRGVIHRDLKPSNVMVGSFGEVQVMDWGLAKVLPRGGVVDDAKARKERPQETVIATARSGSDTDHSHAGSVMGTPSYMAPEQARGEIDRMDERADVFALGSILCEILTGTAAFTGHPSGEIIRKAAKGDTADALSRLAGCGAEIELISLSTDCLAVDPEGRPRDANVVAKRMTAYQAGVQERVQGAERERAVAVARAIEERRRRKVQLALAASLLAFTTLGGLSTMYYVQQRAARVAAGQRVIDQVSALRVQAVAQPEDIQRWELALAAVGGADPGGDPMTSFQLLALQKEIRDGLKAARRDKAFIDRLLDIRSAQADDRDGSDTDAAYADAFGEMGIDLASVSPEEAGAKINARPPSVALALAGALDDWAATRRGKRVNAIGAAELSAAARIADPDPWRVGLRATLDQADKAARRTALQALEKTANFDELGPISLHLLGAGLGESADRPLAESVLRRAQQRHPRDVWVNYDLGRILEKLSRRDEAIRFYTVARAIRPEIAHELAHALELRGDSDEAIAVFRDLKRLRPGDVRHLTCLGKSLKAKGLAREADETLEAAVAAGREAIRRKPDRSDIPNNLGNALAALGKLDEANAQHREAIRLRPDRVEPHFNLGNGLVKQGKLEAGIAEYRTAIRLNPDYADGHVALGSVLTNQGNHDQASAEYRAAISVQPDLANAHFNLGISLDRLGKFEEAISEHREAIRLNPRDAEAYYNLGVTLSAQGKFDEAIACYREAIRFQPENAEAHGNLGGLSCNHLRDYLAAESEYRTAIRLKPGNAEAHAGLGIALASQGKSDEAIAEYHTAIRLNPDLANAHLNLGNSLAKQGNLDLAIAEYRKAIELKPDDANGHSNLGLALANQGKRDLAVAEYRKAIQLDPGLAQGHLNLSIALAKQGKLDEAKAESRAAIGLNPGLALAHLNLSTILMNQGKLDLAIAEIRTAIRLDPRDDEAHFNLGNALRLQGNLEAAVDAYRDAIRLNPDNAATHSNLGATLHGQGKFDEAVAVHREAIRLKPDVAASHSNLGNVLNSQGKLVEAVAEFREAIRLQPDFAIAHCKIGIALGAQGDFAGSLAMLRRGHELGSKEPGWHFPSGPWLAQAELRAALAGRLPALLKGAERPKDLGEFLTVAQICYETKRFAAATRFWSEALIADPKLAENRQTQVLYNAACAASLAAAGQGNDDPKPDGDAKAKLREQALVWLEAELSAWKRVSMTVGPGNKELVDKTLVHWRQDTDLASVRDEQELAKLSDVERDAWKSLWVDVAALLKQVEKPTS